MFKITVNSNRTFSVEGNREVIVLDGQPFHWNITSLGENHFHILYNNRSLTAEIVKADYETKTFTFKINGQLYHIQVKDQFDQLLEQMGMNANTNPQIKDIKAPMPGLILEIKVAEGQEIRKGEPVVILEAMKMENIIKSPADGIVKVLKIRKGESVEKNQVLIVL